MPHQPEALPSGLPECRTVSPPGPHDHQAPLRRHRMMRTGPCNRAGMWLTEALLKGHPGSIVSFRTAHPQSGIRVLLSLLAGAWQRVPPVICTAPTAGLVPRCPSRYCASPVPHAPRPLGRGGASHPLSNTDHPEASRSPVPATSHRRTARIAPLRTRSLLPNDLSQGHRFGRLSRSCHLRLG